MSFDSCCLPTRLTTMPLFDLQLKANLEGVTEIKPSEDYRLMVHVQCTSCREKHPNTLALVPGEEHEVHGAKNATAHLVFRCGFCRVESWARFAEAPSGEKTGKKGSKIYYPYVAGDGAPSWQSLTKLECRGMEPVEWVFDDQVCRLFGLCACC